MHSPAQKSKGAQPEGYAEAEGCSINVEDEGKKKTPSTMRGAFCCALVK